MTDWNEKISDDVNQALRSYLLLAHSGPLLWAALLEGAANSMRGGRWPLSGNVDEWIRAWGDVIAQFGMVNLNITESPPTATT